MAALIPNMRPMYTHCRSFCQNFRMIRQFGTSSLRLTLANDSNETISEPSLPDNTSDRSRKPTSNESFATMFRKSKFVQMGSPENNRNGALLFGRIFNIIEDDLYIDFGGKFHCVCKIPKAERGHGHPYSLGLQVQLKVRDLEMSSAFIGSEKHLTISEAKADMLPLRNAASRVNMWHNIQAKWIVNVPDDQQDNFLAELAIGKSKDDTKK